METNKVDALRRIILAKNKSICRWLIKFPKQVNPVRLISIRLNSMLKEIDLSFNNSHLFTLHLDLHLYNYFCRKSLRVNVNLKKKNKNKTTLTY